MQQTGFASADIKISDLSVLYRSGLKGITGVLGVTEFGEVGKPQLVGSWIEYQRAFGGLLTDNEFPLLCKVALDGGARLMVSRAAHYTNPTDKTTVVGVAASVAVGGYTFKASSVGAWGNDLRVSVTPPISGDADVFDVTVSSVKYSQINYTIRNVSKALDDTKISDFNKQSVYVKVSKPTTGTVADLEAKEVSLTNGVEDKKIVANADYIGDAAAKTGIHSFDDTFAITKIAVPAKAIPDIDIALVNYAAKREDVIALVRTPTTVNGTLAIDYRKGGAGVYTHTGINNWHGIMFTGGVVINHPVTGARTTITALAPMLAVLTTKDSKSFPWFSFSGSANQIGNVLGVINNLGVPALKATADSVSANGINPIIEHPSFGVVAWGNATLQKSDTLLKHANIAELVVFIVRGLKPLVQQTLFKPNDIQTWKANYRRVRPFMEYLKTNRAIYDYQYQGDQDIDNISEAKINSKESIDNGNYTFNIIIKPIGAITNISIGVAVVGTGVNFDIQDN